MALNHNPGIVLNGLLTYLDAGNPASYTGTTWRNLISTSYNATLDTAPTFNSANRGSLVYNGTNSRTTITRMVSTDFSLCCWFKTTSTNGTGTDNWWRGGPLVDAEIGGATTDFGLSIGNGRVMLGIGSPDTTIRSPTSLNDGIWHYAVGTRISSSGAIALYIDGVSVATGTARTGALTAQPTIFTGTGYNAANFAGNISIIQIYDKALTLTEVVQNYNAIKGRYI